MKRPKLSSPLTIAIAKGVIAPDLTVFDYGCGRGGDIQRLQELGYEATGFDPYYAPDMPKKKADIVTLSYVLGVIENSAERREVLEEAWALTNKTLIVSAQVQRTRGTVQHGDGWLNKWGIYTKFWTEPEWRSYVESVTGAKARRIGKGILICCKPEIVELAIAA